MMGRAGRSQFDKKGIVLILREEPRKELIKTFVISPFPVESSMLASICNDVNDEITRGRV
jgi:activating signal cointegrator complex subunit 3